jgi:hypothetical protein
MVRWSVELNMVFPPSRWRLEFAALGQFSLYPALDTSSEYDKLQDLAVFAVTKNEHDAGWSSPVAREAHNLEVAGSNPVPATLWGLTTWAIPTCQANQR